MDYGDFKDELKRHDPDGQLQRLDIPEISIVFDLLKLFRRIYQHELTPEPLKDFVYMEVRRALRKEFDIRGYLEGRTEIF